jgi:Protein of unknown function (DUF3224)
MNTKIFTIVCLGASICLVLGLNSFAQSKRSKTQTTKPKEQRMTKHASGTFEVKLAPQQDDAAKETGLGRMTIDKTFHGDLEASSKGQMLAAMTEVKGSAGYVAIERVTGTLHGHTGSFVLLHNGIMDRSVPQLSVVVVPDSGTDELVGLTGKMTINIADGKHSYEFEYSIVK